MIDNYKIVDGYKFMWDGKEYDNLKHAQEVEDSYKSENFETKIIEEDGKCLIYTRRVVTEIIVEGDAP